MSDDKIPQTLVTPTIPVAENTTTAMSLKLPAELPTKPKHKGGPKRNTYQALIDRHFIQEKLGENIPQYRIAEMLNARPGIPYSISARAISDDCRKIEELWRARTVAERTYWIAHTLRNIDKLEAELWRAYWRSTQNAESQRNEVTPGEMPLATDSPEQRKKKLKAATQKVIKTSEGQCGDPQYLRLILDLQEKRIKLLGHEAPAKVEDVTKPRPHAITAAEGVKYAEEYLRRQRLKLAQSSAPDNDATDRNRIAGTN